MKLVLRNGCSIQLPRLDEIDTNGNGKTSDITTSFLSEFKKRLRGDKINTEELMRAYCLDKLQSHIDGQYQSYFEPLGGVGVTASIFMQDEKETHLNELDDACLGVLAANFPEATLYKQDMFKFDYQRNFDTTFIDFNNYTLAKYVNLYGDVVRNALAHANKYLIINDCSVFYLNRGAKSFENYSKILGQTVTDYISYWPALNEYYQKQFPGWKITRVETFYASSYLLFSRIDDPLFPEEGLVTHHNTSEEMKADPMLWLELPSTSKRLM